MIFSDGHLSGNFQSHLQEVFRFIVRANIEEIISCKFRANWEKVFSFSVGGKTPSYGISELG